MMQHAETDTFLKPYLSRRVTMDTQAIVRGLAPQDELMRAACRMSRWINPDRPWKLTPEQSASVNYDPRILKLERAREKDRGKASQKQKYEELGREIRNEKQRLRDAPRIKIRKEWDQDQAVKDIEQQLSGLKFSENVKVKLESASNRTPEHTRLIECIVSLLGSTIEEEMQRFSDAVNAVIAYCKIEEGNACSVRHQARSIKSSLSPQSSRAIGPFNERLEVAIVSVYEEKRPRICFLCLGNEKKIIEERTHAFSTPGDLSKHFKRQHLRYIEEDDTITCPICKVLLDSRSHLQNHALSVHGTVS